MNTEQKFSYLSKSLKDTEKLGESIARNISSPILIELSGDLGGGKTALVKAIAKSLGIDKTIKSPTFNIHLSYIAPSGIKLEHFDLYRLEDDEIVLNELKESVDDEKAIVCVEWSQNFTKHISNNRLFVNCLYKDIEKRMYEISAGDSNSDKIVESIKNDFSN